MAKVNTHYETALDNFLLSAKKYLHGIDKIVIHRRTVKNDQEMFLNHAELLKQLYHSGDYNILYCDLDIVFVKPTRIFGEFDYFSMVGNNCGVRYYPAGGMTDELWQIQQEWVSNWQTDFASQQERIHNWQYEQDMYMAMHQTVLQEHKFVNAFGKVVHQVYNPPAEGFTMVHCCGTSQQFNGIELQRRLLDLSLQGDQQGLLKLLQSPMYSLSHPENDGAPWLGT
jgi:hypothetical protein